MVAATAGTAAISLLLNLIASNTNAMLSVPFHWHVVLGGWGVRHRLHGPRIR